MKKKLRIVNHERGLLVVTTYPNIAALDKNSRSALYKKTFLDQLSKIQNVVVLAQKIPDQKKIYDLYRRLTVARIFTQGNNFSVFKIIPYMLKYDRTKNVLFQFDMHTFGGMLPLILLIPLFLIIKYLGKYTYVEFQNITLNRFTLLYYRIIGAVTDKIITQDVSTKEKLMPLINEAKITALPLKIMKKAIASEKPTNPAYKMIVKQYKQTVSNPYPITSDNSPVVSY